MADPFITTIDLGAYLRRDVEGELIAEIACEAACDFLRDMTGQQLDGVVDDTAEVAVERGNQVVLLPQIPVVAVDSVGIVNARTGAVTPLDVTKGDYLVDFVNGTLVMPFQAVGPVRYRVVYSHGFGAPREFVTSGSGGLLWTDPVEGSGSGEDVVTFPVFPGTLRMLALQAAARIYDQGLVKQESTGGYQAIYSASDTLGFTRNEMNLLAKYRRGR